MYKKGAGNDKQGKDAGNRTLCPYRNFSQAIINAERVIVKKENFKAEIIFNMKCPYNYQPLFA